MSEVTKPQELLSATIARHYDNGENNLSARNASRILHLRNFNNFVKSTLITNGVSMARYNRAHNGHMNVLDLACGKGGDLNKWRFARSMDYLVAVDISPGSISNCHSRYKEMKRRNSLLFNAQFIVADCTRVKINTFFKDSLKLHLVSCQFAFHYCFESIQQAECMMQNVSDNLVSGGMFIGTIPDAREIVRRQKECGEKQFGNSIYNIEFMCDIDKPFPIFGAKYNFHLEGVVDCPEFLVYFPALVKLAKSYGLELKTKRTFAEFFENRISFDEHLLNRIAALELYPPQEGVELMGTEEDYDTAKQFLNENKLKSVGTLSKSEWEVATLYMVFVFEKM